MLAHTFARALRVRASESTGHHGGRALPGVRYISRSSVSVCVLACMCVYRRGRAAPHPPLLFLDAIEAALEGSHLHLQHRLEFVALSSSELCAFSAALTMCERACVCTACLCVQGCSPPHISSLLSLDGICDSSQRLASAAGTFFGV